MRCASAVITTEPCCSIGYNKTKRWRVVTLQGQLIDTSGTMSGGGKRVARGAMSSKLRQAGSVTRCWLHKSACSRSAEAPTWTPSASNDWRQICRA